MMEEREARGQETHVHDLAARYQVFGFCMIGSVCVGARVVHSNHATSVYIKELLREWAKSYRYCTREDHAAGGVAIRAAREGTTARKLNNANFLRWSRVTEPRYRGGRKQGEIYLS